MEKQLQVFGFEGHRVRVMVRDGEPWWVAKDVCEALEHSNSRVALERLDDDEKGVSTVYTLGGPQDMQVINEQGLYRLIFTSRVEKAELFKRWLAHDVLPSIRKNGMYAKDELLDNPDLLLEVVTRLRDERKARLELEAKVAEQKPLVSFAETCLTSKDSVLVRELAKVATKSGLVTGEKRLYRLLREWGLILSNSTEPSQRAMDAGYFEVIQRPVTTPYGEILSRTPRVTPRGQVYIIERLRSEQKSA